MICYWFSFHPNQKRGPSKNATPKLGIHRTLLRSSSGKGTSACSDISRGQARICPLGSTEGVCIPTSWCLSFRLQSCTPVYFPSHRLRSGSQTLRCLAPSPGRGARAQSLQVAVLLRKGRHSKGKAMSPLLPPKGQLSASVDANMSSRVAPDSQRRSKMANCITRSERHTGKIYKRNPARPWIHGELGIWSLGHPIFGGGCEKGERRRDSAGS